MINTLSRARIYLEYLVQGFVLPLFHTSIYVIALSHTYLCVCIVASIGLQQHHHWTETQEVRCDKVNRQTPTGSAVGSARELQYGCGDCKSGYIENIKGGCILSKIIHTCHLPLHTGRKCSMEFEF